MPLNIVVLLFQTLKWDAKQLTIRPNEKDRKKRLSSGRESKYDICTETEEVTKTIPTPNNRINITNILFF